MRVGNLQRLITAGAVATILCGSASGWVPSPSSTTTLSRSTESKLVRVVVVAGRAGSLLLRLNLFDALSGRTSGDELQPVLAPLPYGNPLLPVAAARRSSVAATTTLAVRERGLSFTGEDFDVVSLPSREPVCRVRGALLHLPGKDKMRITHCAENGGPNSVAAVLDRKLVALTPTYDLYRGDAAEKIAWIEKVGLTLFRDCFQVHLVATPNIGPFLKGPAAYQLTGDFQQRRFVMRDAGNDAIVAVVSKAGWLPQPDAANHYQVRVAPGMDAGLVVACLSAIDEEYDEEHQKQRRDQEEKKKKDGGGGGWFG